MQIKNQKHNTRRIFLLIVFFYSLALSAHSQDKIITITKDTIDCKITKISRNTIFFDLITSGIRTEGSLPLSKVLNYTISAGGVAPEKPESLSVGSFERIRLGISGGAGYLLASSEKAEEALTGQGLDAGKAKSYYRNMKTGWNANADLTFMITPDLGAGFKYKFFYTAGSVEGFFGPADGVHLIYTTYGERIFVNYYGPLVYYQQFIGQDEKIRLTSAYSFGMATYRNEAEYLNGHYLLTGKSFGTDATLGLEYFITDHFSIGADLSVFYSSIRRITMTDGKNHQTLDLDKENYENLSRMELSIGIRFYLWKK